MATDKELQTVLGSGGNQQHPEPPEQWGLVVEEPGTGSQSVPDFSKRWDGGDASRIEHLRASVQELRRVTAIATAWLTPGDYPPCEVDGIPIPEVDVDQREVVVMLRAALRDTRGVN